MKLKYEDYTKKTSLVIELSEILAGYTVFTTDSESNFKHRLNLVRSVHLSRLCIQFVFTDATTKVLILGEDEPYWSETEVTPTFGYPQIEAEQVLEQFLLEVVEILYIES